MAAGDRVEGSSDIGMDILERNRGQGNLSDRVTLLSGGVGGARLARGVLAATRPEQLTIVTNVGDDEDVYGLHVSPDLDTVLYTLAGVEGSEGWGLAGDEFRVLDHLASLGEDTRFRIGDRDLATNMFRTRALRAGTRLSEITAKLVEAFGLSVELLPATDDRLRTKVRTSDDKWRSFQEYFVLRGHQDEVAELHFEGADRAQPAPGVVEGIEDSGTAVIAPSNPPLSIWPILAVPGIREALKRAPRVIAVSPLFKGRALKGPADRVLRSLGLPEGNQGVVAAYERLLTDFVIDIGDATDAEELAGLGMRVHVTDTRLTHVDAAARFATWMLALP
ncbi:MAG: 2-phospho-L-lactate transferase [Acidimicrobiia bacterium]